MPMRLGTTFAWLTSDWLRVTLSEGFTGRISFSSRLPPVKKAHRILHSNIQFNTMHVQYLITAILTGALQVTTFAVIAVRILAGIKILRVQSIVVLSRCT